MTPDLPPEVEVHGWLEAGVAVPVEADASPEVGIQLARLQTVLNTPWYGGMFQVDAASATSKLLDASVRFGRLESVSLTAGRFKTPLSLDFGVGAPKMILPERMLLVEAATQREIGAQLRVQRGRVVGMLGVFDSVSAFELSGPGVRPVAALDVGLGRGWRLHGGASAWLRPEELSAVEGAHTWDDLGDLGVEYARGGTTVMLEGLVAHAVDAELGWEGGVGALAAHRWAAGRAELEPAVGWDSARLDGQVAHRATGAVNLHLDDWFAVAQVAGEVTLADAGHPAAALGRAQLQVGF